MTLIVGLTGGIGSGKTVASDHFAELGVPVIDTDVVARSIVQPGQPTLDTLIEVFGNGILQGDGQLDRNALRKLAFSNPENKAMLDDITHPAIRAEALKQIASVAYPYCIVVVPLLTADSPFAQMMQRTLVIIAERKTKIERVKKRSGLSHNEVEKIMGAQLSDRERLAFADDVIDNNHAITHVKFEVDKLHEKYLKINSD